MPTARSFSSPAARAPKRPPRGGAGNDKINGAPAGPAARVNCGSGRDKVRSNTNERRRLRGCETRYSIR